jgi:hypothetical protein
LTYRFQLRKRGLPFDDEGDGEGGIDEDLREALGIVRKWEHKMVSNKGAARIVQLCVVVFISSILALVAIKLYTGTTKVQFNQIPFSLAPTAHPCAIEPTSTISKKDFPRLTGRQSKTPYFLFLLLIYCAVAKEDYRHDFDEEFYAIAGLLLLSVFGMAIFSTCIIRFDKAKKEEKTKMPERQDFIAAANHLSSKKRHQQNSVVPVLKNPSQDFSNLRQLPGEREVQRFVVLRGLSGMELARGQLAQLWKMSELQLRLRAVVTPTRLDDLMWVIAQWKAKIKEQELLKLEVQKQQGVQAVARSPPPRHRHNEQGYARSNGGNSISLLKRNALTITPNVSM